MIPSALLTAAVGAALTEDAPWGDISAELFLPASARAEAVLRAREPGIFPAARFLPRRLA